MTREFFDRPDRSFLSMIGDVVSSTSPIEVSGENLALASFEWFVSSLRRRSLGVDKLSVVAVVDDDVDVASSLVSFSFPAGAADDPGSFFFGEGD